MSHVQVVMKPQGKVLGEFMADRSRISIIRGPLGSGKTVQCCQKIFKLMTEQPPDNNGLRKTRWFAVRNTYSDLTNTTIKDWLQHFGELGQYKAGGMSPPTSYLKFRLPDETVVQAEMIFLALDRIDSIKKLRGTQVTGFWLNELKELPKAVIDMADGRHGRYPENCGWHGIVADTNAPDSDHWLYNLEMVVKPKEWRFFIQPGGVKRNGLNQDGTVNWEVNEEAENVVNLPDGTGYYTKMLGGKSDQWIAVNLANEFGFVTDGLPIYMDYSDQMHCGSFNYLDHVPIYRGWDFGTPACVLAQYTPKGRLIVLNEFTSDMTMGISQFSEHVVNECAPLLAKGHEFIDVGDPAGDARSQTDERTCFEILWQKGINIFPGKQDVTARLESVRYFLSRLIDGRPAFSLHERCLMLRKGFQGGYCFRRLQTAAEKYVNKPDKNKYSHPHDALQYIATFIRMGHGVDDDFDYGDIVSRNPVTGY